MPLWGRGSRSFRIGIIRRYINDKLKTAQRAILTAVTFQKYFACGISLPRDLVMIYETMYSLQNRRKDQMNGKEQAQVFAGFPHVDSFPHVKI